MAGPETTPRSKFCCCLSLKTAGVLIGSLGFFISAITVTYIAVILVHFDCYYGKTTTDYGREARVGESTVVSPGSRVINSSYILPDVSRFYSCVLTAEIIGVVVHLILIIGSAKEYRHLLLPYITYKVVYICIQTYLVLFMISVEYSHKQATFCEILFIFVISQYIVFQIYCCISMTKLFLELKLKKFSRISFVSNSSILDYAPPPYSNYAEECERENLFTNRNENCVKF